MKVNIRDVPVRSKRELMPIRLRVLAALCILCLPYVMLGVWIARVNGFQSECAFVASVALLFWSLAFVTRTWRRFFVVQIPILILSAAFAGYTLALGSGPGEGLAYVMVTSSWGEVRGFFQIWEGKTWLLAAMVLAMVYILLASSAPTSRIYSGKNVYVRFGPLVALLIAGVYASQNALALIGGLELNPLIGTALFVAGPLRQARASMDRGATHKVPYHASRDESREEVHILVIGESARRDSWSVYGYRRETTPNLDKLRGEAIFFQRARSDANLTAYAVPILLTGTPPARFAMKAIQGNLVDLAKEAGYHTAWLMNQDPHISLLAGMSADRMVYPRSIASLVAANLPCDEILLPDFRSELGNQGMSRFIGIHTFGSHWDYATRYPIAFNRFSSTKIPDHLPLLSGEPDPRVLDSYDNSVAYTDWFLGQIINDARKLTVPTTVTYFSDHGEDLLILDGRAGHGTRAYSPHQYEIPAFVWVNSAYRAAHPEKVEAMLVNSTKEIRSHNLFASLADLMGIRWPGASPADSFASRDFVPDTSREVIAGGVLQAYRD